MLTIAHLSDTHFGGPPAASERTRRVLDHLAAMDPPVDVVLVTGDIADHGTADEYAEAAAVLGSWTGPAPMLLCPGNHDVREGYAALRGRPAAAAVAGPVNEAHRVAGALFLMADSMVPAVAGKRIDHGVLTEETLSWIDGELADRAPGELAFVCLHHPPVPIHITLMDPIRLRNAADLAAVLVRHDDVAAVLTGHAHSACATTFAGLPMLIPGGVASTVTLDADDLPRIDTSLPPMLALHLVDETSLGLDGAVVTHWRAL